MTWFKRNDSCCYCYYVDFFFQIYTIKICQAFSLCKNIKIQHIINSGTPRLHTVHKFWKALTFSLFPRGKKLENMVKCSLLCDKRLHMAVLFCDMSCPFLEVTLAFFFQLFPSTYSNNHNPWRPWARKQLQPNAQRRNSHWSNDRFS